LIADDEAVIADTLATILSQKGYRAISVHSGEEAILAAQSVEPDVLIRACFINRFGLKAVTYV
jgi:DNA-binding response OmpR family regulator